MVTRLKLKKIVCLPNLEVAEKKPAGSKLLHHSILYSYAVPVKLKKR